VYYLYYSILKILIPTLPVIIELLGNYHAFPYVLL